MIVRDAGRRSGRAFVVVRFGNVSPTAHPDIWRVGEPRMPAGELKAAIQALEEAAIEGDRMRVEAILCEWIPTFAPSFAALPSSEVREGRAAGRLSRR